MSKSAIRFRDPKPVKNAFALLERFEPSITHTPASGNPTRSANPKSASRSAPFGRLVKRLKSGMIQVGATYCTPTVHTVTSAQHQSQARGPAESKSQRMAASNGPPSATARPTPVATSVQKVRGVARLKPYFSSMTKVEYQENGRLTRLCTSSNAATNARPGRDLRPSERAHPVIDSSEPAAQPERQQQREPYARRDPPEPRSLAGVGLSAPVPVGVVEIAEVARRLRAEGAQVEQVGDEVDGEVDHQRRNQQRSPGQHVRAS